MSNPNNIPCRLWKSWIVLCVATPLIHGHRPPFLLSKKNRPSTFLTIPLSLPLPLCTKRIRHRYFQRNTRQKNQRSRLTLRYSRREPPPYLHYPPTTTLSQFARVNREEREEQASKQSTHTLSRETERKRATISCIGRVLIDR